LFVLSTEILYIFFFPFHHHCFILSFTHLLTQYVGRLLIHLTLLETTVALSTKGKKQLI